MSQIILIALGGNAISEPDEEGNLPQQYAHTRNTMSELADFLAANRVNLIITHGNGPQVGNILFRSEYAARVIYPIALDVCVSDSQGGMGYMIQQLLLNELRRHQLDYEVATVITQVEVDPEDPSFETPTKFIGRPYSADDKDKLSQQRGWLMKEDIGRGWRRVVPSPLPLHIVEGQVVKKLVNTGTIVIAAGGGGIPVVRSPEGDYQGVEAVVDKDLASALLAKMVGAEVMVSITGTEYVYFHYKKPGQKALKRMKLSQARAYLERGEFPPGSMGPKIQAAIQFLEAGGKKALITYPGKLQLALQGKTGTLITPD